MWRPVSAALKFTPNLVIEAAAFRYFCIPRIHFTFFLVLSQGSEFCSDRAGRITIERGGAIDTSGFVLDVLLLLLVSFLRRAFFFSSFIEKHWNSCSFSKIQKTGDFLRVRSFAAIEHAGFIERGAATSDTSGFVFESFIICAGLIPISLNFVGKSVMLHRMAFRSSFMLAFLLLSGLQVWGAHEDDLPGWMGENHVSRDSEGEVIQQVARIDPTRVIQLSWKPRAFLHKNFLTDAECEHMIELAKDKLEKSMVADNESGKSVASEIRTSSGMFLMKGQDDIISRIEDKIATWTFLPKENGEAIQVLRYQDGEKYEPHFDYFHDKNNQALGGHRIATVLMYLSDVVKGGETVFPSSEDRGGPKDDTWSPCGKTGVAVKPSKGDALLFFSLHPSAVPDESSLHTGCPVLEGEKWSATKWIHVLSFEKPRPKNGACTNEDEKCDEWAAYGECQKNPAYMVGTKEWPGACRKACKLC